VNDAFILSSVLYFEAASKVAKHVVDKWVFFPR